MSLTTLVNVLFTIIMAGVLILMDVALACSISQKETVGHGEQHYPHLTDYLLLGSPHGHFIDIIKSPYVLLMYRSFQRPCILRHAHHKVASDTVTGRKEFLLSPLSALVIVCVCVCLGVRRCVYLGVKGKDPIPFQCLFCFM